MGDPPDVTGAPVVGGSTVGRRLFLLVLFPLTILAVTIGIVAHDRWTERQAGADVVARVDDLRSLVALQSVVYGERAAVELEFRSASFGVPARLGAGLLGVSEPETTFGPTDEALIATTIAPLGVTELLATARSLHASSDPNMIRAYDAVDDVIVEKLVSELEVMKSIGVGTADAELAAVLQQLEAVVVAFSASTDQTTGLADSWFGPSETRNRSLSSLGFQTARYELAVAEINPDRLPVGLRESLVTRSDPVSAAVVQLLTGGIDDPGQRNLEDLPMIISVFEASFARNATLGDLVEESADDVERSASRIAGDANDAFVAALVLGGFAIAISVLLSWRLAISIAAPMASVAARTRQLQAGQIEASPLELTGPRELRDVASAINDVSTNLEALEGNLRALARADLEDVRLAQPLPGQLGETLMNSVDTLSSSIADRRNLQTRLGHQANHDALSGLANRAAVLDRIAARLRSASTSAVGLMFVDLDDFKRVNDVFGHGAGDRVLVEVGRRLIDASRPADMVARLGGDEFLVVVENVESVEALIPLARRIIEAVGQPMPTAGTGGLVVEASVGIAVSSDSNVTALDFLSQADAALYKAKTSDERVCLFDDDLRLKMGRQASIEQRLRRALAEGELEVHYQPVLESDTLRVGQLEALVRWIGEDTYGPDDFIPVAEQSDLVVDIDRFVLKTATAELAALLADGVATDLSVAVNLSGRHLLHAEITAHVAEALTLSGLDATRLIIEVTETALIADFDRAAEHLHSLRSMGVRASIDDFGTGFTSISQLRRLPIDELKIDRSLVTELPEEQVVVRVVRELAEHFGMTTVAEGVETQEQADFLRDLGCSQLQGWLFAKAMSASDLRVWFESRANVPTPNRVTAGDLP